MGKLNRWEKIKDATFHKKMSDQQEAEAKLHKKELKIEKASKNFEEGIKERVERIQIKKDKWHGKIESHKQAARHDEIESHKKGIEHLKAISAFLDEKRKKNFVQRTGTIRSSPSF